MGQLASIRPGDIVRIRDERWRVVRATWHGQAAILEVGGWDRDNRAERTRFLWPIEHVERLPAPDAPRVVSPARWRRLARLALADAVPRVDSLRAASRANVDVIPFQLEPALAVTRGLGCRILIADEVGLGKTIQAGLVIADILERVPEGHVLVVSPAALREQWQRELEDRFRIDCAVFDAAGLARAAATAGPAANPWLIPSVVITSIDFVKRPEVIRALESMVWDAAVLDEAHALAGVSDRAAAADRLARRARVVLLLSATPHSGDNAAFSRLCGTGELTDRAPLLLFRRTRKDAGLDSTRRTRWFRVRPTPAELTMHRSLLAYARLVWRQEGPLAAAARLAMSVLVKRACSSAASLARSVERRLLLTQSREDTHAQLGLPLDLASSADAEPLLLLAAAGLRNGLEENAHLERLLALARAAAAGESKLAAVGRLVRRSKEPAIVFTEYRDTLAQVEEALSGAGTLLLLHGGLTLRERRDVVRRFTEGPPGVLLATDAASEGLNLHHRCRLVINLELPWTPLRLEQRVGRVDRIGQRAPVHAVHLIARDTEEERTVARLLERSARAGAVLAGGTGGDEDEVARHVFEGPRKAPGTRLEACPGGVVTPDRPFVTPDLSGAALEEAGRILAGRSLLRSGGWDGLEMRPAITVTGKRSSPRRRCIWAYRISFLDRAGCVVWSTVVGATATAAGASAADELLHTLIACQNEARHAIAGRHQATLVQMTAALARAHELAVRRERAIAADLRRTRARLASVQPGLFDRRADRAASTASAVLDAALDRCTAKLEALAAAEGPAEGPRELVFAVALG